ncbi:MAG TPA: hypothetical protein VK465_15880 [Fibrobacteria bacterium]|nr:hypothetical protein [Fibrobacteria bacterium]
MRIAWMGVFTGLLLIPADNYFGKGDGTLGFLVLGSLLLGTMLIEFQGILRLIRHPRFLDILFVGGASSERRIALAVDAVLESARLQPILPSIAILVVAAVKGYGPWYIAALFGSILLESALICGIFVTLVKLGMVPLSTARYSGSETSVPGFLGSRSGSFLIATTYSLARRISRFLGTPYGWLVRRRLLHVFRVDPVFNLIYAGFILCLGGVLALEWNQRAGAVFSVVGTLLTLTLIQLATADCDTHFRESPYLFPGAWKDCRSSLVVYLAIAALFSCFFGVTTIIHGGVPNLSAVIGFLQTPITCLGFPFLLVTVGPNRQWTMNNRVLMNLCFLGLAGSLFLFGSIGFGAALGVLAWAMYRCNQVCRGEAAAQLIQA